jgi:hypothetical protein
LFYYYFTFVLGHSTVAVAYFDDSDEDESVVKPDAPSASDSSDQPMDPTSDPPTDPTKGGTTSNGGMTSSNPVPFLPARPPSNPAPPAPSARLAKPIVNAVEKNKEARLALFKPTICSIGSKEARTDKDWGERRAKRHALVDQKRAVAAARHVQESQEQQDALASYYYRRMEEEREELEKGMAAAGQLPPLPVDSWELGEENGEESGSINTADMMPDMWSEEEE